MMDPAVTESAVVGVPDEVKGEAIRRFVVARDDRSGRVWPRRSALVAEHLGKAFRPARVVVVPELPRTRSAKISGGRSARRSSARIRVTCRAWRTPRRSIPSGPRSLTRRMIRPHVATNGDAAGIGFTGADERHFETRTSRCSPSGSTRGAWKAALWRRPTTCSARWRTWPAAGSTWWSRPLNLPDASAPT